TFTEDVMNLAKQWTTEPSIVEIESLNVASDNVELFFFKEKGAYEIIQDVSWARGCV
ncbi:ATP-dependent RNA helicase RhlB, partial [Pseudomonas syringae]|nr:ATP-dependent RNA helicase RhlB [Pseudomonas syringae]